MKQRILTALILAPTVLTLVFSTSSIPVFILAIICAFLGTREVLILQDKKGLVIPVLSATALWAAGYFLKDHYDYAYDKVIFWLFLLFFGSVFLILFFLKREGDRRLLVPGLLWVLCPLLSLVLLHYSIPKVHAVWWAPNPLLMALVPVWAGDSAAIFVGKKFGKRLLAPKISPSKTVEGSIGYLLACVVFAYAVATSIGITPKQGILVGLVAGILGQAGDLFESAIKRSFHAKDSGDILPGHGGILDRIDSMLMSALPITALILLYR